MSTSTIAATGSWAATSITGVKDGNLQNIGAGRITYHVGTSVPAASYTGMILGCEVPHPVKIGTGETLYVRAMDMSTGDLRFTDVV